MKISYNWLRQYIDITESPEQIGKILTSLGLEVESIEPYEPIKGGLKGLVIAEVKTCEKHPQADRLSITQVDAGTGTLLQVVCGAPNVAAGQKVILATVGSVMYPVSGESFTINKSKIRGEVSEGMLCAEDEIGLGTSHEGILVLKTELPNGTPASSYFNIETDYTIEIGLTPNRVDAASHVGVARDLRAKLERRLSLPVLSDIKQGNKSLPISIKIENEEACPRYAGLTISGVTVKPSPEWLQHRLKAIGISSINNIVDVTNFVLHELGQPLHAFDADKISGNQVIVKNFPQGTPFVTLDGVERKLQANDLVIANADSPMCLAGVFGGAESGIKPETTNIFLESAYFSPNTIRKTSQHHALKTDAAFRFERGCDPNIVPFALKRAASLILEIAGGEIASPITDIYPNPIAGFPVSISYHHINRLIGIEIPVSKVKTILSNLEIQIVSENESGLEVIVPAYRVDVTREADIIEDIIRVYGFDQINAPNHIGSTFLAEFPVNDPNRIRNTIGRILADNGFNEIITNSITKETYKPLVGDYDLAEQILILNKLSEDLGAMRQTLLFSGLEVVSYNLNRKQKDLKIFEFGRVYSHKEGKYKEKEQLSIFLTGNKQSESWQMPSKPVTFFDAAQVVSLLFQKFRVQAKLTQIEGHYIYETGGKAIATIYALSKNQLKSFDIRQEVFYVNIDFERIVKMNSASLTYKEISKFPEVRRDLSLVLDKAIKFEDLERIAKQSEKKLLRDIHVFDVYEGDKIDQGKKAYALSFILQDQNATLTEDLIEKTMSKLISSFEKEFGAVIRR